MFFDDISSLDQLSSGDIQYTDLMQKAAVLQQQLFAYRYNAETRQEKELPAQPARRTMFARKKVEPSPYEKQKQALQAHRELLQSNRRAHGGSRKIYWWEIPWDRVEQDLLIDLVGVPDEGNARFLHTYELHQRGSTFVLLLHEEGHISSFSSDASYSNETFARYSHDYIEQKRSELNNLQTLDNIINCGKTGPVRSALTDQVYDSGADYVLSAENWMVQDYQRTRLERDTHYTVSTSAVTAVSQSSHYVAWFAVAEFSLEQGEVTHLQLLGNQLIQSRGDMPDWFREFCLARDPAVLLADYLVKNTDLKKVPSALFDRDYKEGSATFEEALRQAKLCTCMADLL